MNRVRMIFFGMWIILSLLRIFSFEVKVKRGGDFSNTFRDSLALLEAKTPYGRVDNLYYNKKFPIYFPSCYLLLAALSYLTDKKKLEEIEEIWIPVGKLVFFTAVLGLWRLLTTANSSELNYYIQGILCFSLFNSAALYEIAVSHFELWTFSLALWGIVLIREFRLTLLGGALLGLSLSFKQSLLPLYPFIVLILGNSRTDLYKMIIGFLIPCALLILPFIVWDPVQFFKATILFHLTRVDTNLFFGYRVPTVLMFIPSQANWLIYALFGLIYLYWICRSFILLDKKVAFHGYLFTMLFVFLSNRVLFKQYYVNLSFAILILIILALPQYGLGRLFAFGDSQTKTNL